MVFDVPANKWKQIQKKVYSAPANSVPAGNGSQTQKNTSTVAERAPNVADHIQQQLRRQTVQPADPNELAGFLTSKFALLGETQTLSNDRYGRAFASQAKDTPLGV